MTAPRQHLRTTLAQKVQRHGLVIWDDANGEYVNAFADVTPDDANVYTFSGSWFELRHQIEPHLDGESAPAVVVYIPASRPKPDPLEELRALGGQFTIKLATLLKQALGNELGEERIATLGKQCATIEVAEAALNSGEAAVDARLITLIGDPSPITIAAQLLSGAHNDALRDDKDLADAARHGLVASLGGSYDGVPPADLGPAVFRQIVLAQLHAALNGLPDDLVKAHQLSTATQTRTGTAVVQAMRSDNSCRDVFVELANEVDKALHLAALIKWDDALEDVDTTAAIEWVAVDEGIRRLEAGDYTGAKSLAQKRLAASWWVRSDSPVSAKLQPRWRAIVALANLSDAISAGIPALQTVAELVDWYSTSGWEIDSFYRQTESTRVTAGDALDDLGALFKAARTSYEEWLDQLLPMASLILASGDIADVHLQRSIHETHVGSQTGRLAYVLVDALCYELGRDLARRLDSGCTDAVVTISPSLATPPTITPVGMAAVLPGAADDFAIDLDADNRLVVSVGGEPVRTVADRVNRLRHAHGKVTDLKLDDVANYDNKQLKKAIDGADLVLVRSTEIDAYGETDQLASSWYSFGGTLSVLQTAMAKLLHAGIEHLVITADHGFLAVRRLGTERRIDNPAAGNGESHRRAWIGRGGDASDSTIKVSLAEFGVRSDLDIITPRGLGVFTTSGGGLQFFHGGLSPQELVIPVITVSAREVSAAPSYAVTLAVAGDRISTGVVSVTLTMEGDLFSSEARVLMQLTQDGERVAGVVDGDGVDTTTDSIEATVDTPRVVSLLITKNLVAGSKVTLEVLDAATGVRLSSRNIDVAATVIVEDDLD